MHNKLEKVNFFTDYDHVYDEHAEVVNDNAHLDESAAEPAKRVRDGTGIRGGLGSFTES